MAKLSFVFAAVRDGRWYWELGDLDAGAVVVTGLYLLTSIVCLLAARQLNQLPSQTLRRVDPKSEATFWFVLAFLLLLLGINKQADLQSLITLHGRDLFQYVGLYQVRRMFQIVFIALVAILALLCVLFGLWVVRRRSWPSHLAAIGLGFQAAFIVIRAASFHHIDYLLGQRIANLKINLLLESIGLVLMLLAAVGRLRRTAGHRVTDRENTRANGQRPWLDTHPYLAAIPRPFVWAR